MSVYFALRKNFWSFALEHGRRLNILSIMRSRKSRESLVFEEEQLIGDSTYFVFVYFEGEKFNQR